jgi:glycosyltransferase involved in cell wall biosynthesis
VAVPEVSVVIPTRDRRDLLLRTLRGVLRQRDVSLEVVIVDDTSEDGTSEAVAALGDERVRVLGGHTPVGVSAARNRGIGQARGEWVAFLDDDDLWSPDKLALQLGALSRSGATAAFGAAALVDGRLEVLDVHRVEAGERVVDRILSRSTIPAGASNVVASRALVEEIGGFDETLGALADWEMWIRLALHGSFASVPEVVVAYVHHESNMSIGRWSRYLAEFDAIRSKYRREREERGVELDGVGFNRWLAGEPRRGGEWRGAIGTYLGGARRFRSPGNIVRAAGVPFERVLGPRGHGGGRTERVDWLTEYAGDA